jgi:endoribonuclease Dicer
MTEQISLVDVSSSVSLKGEDSSNVALLRGLFINDVATSDPADCSADVRKDELSSDDSDNDDEAVPNQNDFSQRRRVQNAQFEALSATPRRRYLVRLLLT